MKAPNLIISIPEPCHQDWQGMQPEDKGRFCTACSKTVIDFSRKTDAEIAEILLQHKDQKPCGHFKKTQVNRPLHLSINLSQLPANVSGTRAFAIAAFLAFGMLLFSCTNYQGKKINGLDLKDGQEEFYTTGLPMMQETVVKDTIPQTSTATREFVDGEMAVEKDTTTQEELFDIDEMAYTTMGVMDIGPRYDDENLVKLITDSLQVELSMQITPPASTDPNEQASGLLIYPNPAGREFNIQYELINRVDVRIDVYDIQGAWLKTLVNVKQQHEGNYTIPVSPGELANGIYIVNMIKEGQLFTKRLIIEK